MVLLGESWASAAAPLPCQRMISTLPRSVRGQAVDHHRVLPLTDWADLKDAIHNLRIDLVAAKPEQAEKFAAHDISVEVVAE